jgi:acetyl-CoA synthetase
VVLEPDATPSEPLREELRTLVGAEHGKPFRPRDVRFVPALPKTQSGKIIRRAIASIADGEDVGDLSSIENPDSLEAIEPVR